MKLLHTFFFFIVTVVRGYGQAVQFIIPVEGKPSRDYFYTYYIDHDSSAGIADYLCGDKTYNGHCGTDLAIRNFKTMDSGVYAIAAAAGRVVVAKDGLYDRNKAMNNNGWGNYVAILHDDSIITYYCHLKKKSISCSVGDTVTAYQRIGQVGSSGSSKGPHLHFEIRNKQGIIIDPFYSECSNRTYSYWAEQPKPDTSTYVIDYGLLPFIPTADTLKEGDIQQDTFHIYKDSLICFWAFINGLKQNDKLETKWFRKNIQMFTYPYIWQVTSGANYTWAWYKMPQSKGDWTVAVYVNNKLLVSRRFYVRF
jgi:hypothetical protein